MHVSRHPVAVPAAVHPGLRDAAPRITGSRRSPEDRRQLAPRRQSRPTRRFLTAALAAGTVAACGGGGDAGTGPTPPPGPVAPTIAVQPPSITLDGVGSTRGIAAAVTPAGASVSWSSESPSVATVAGSGASATVTAAGPGSTTIVATVANAGLQATARIPVTVVPVVRQVVVTPATAALTVGATRPLVATVTGDAGVSTRVTWSSATPTVAGVDSTGLVTALAPGTATIRAQSVATPSVSATAAITVTALPRVQAVAITPAADSALIGQSRGFTAVVTADSGLATTVTWRTSAPAVAGVSAAGLVTALTAGTTTITAIATADTLVRATATFTVRAPTVRALALTLSPTLLVGASAQAAVTITADSGANAALTWTSSAPAVAAVSDAGLVTGVSAGTTTITVRATAAPAIEASTAVTVTVPPSTSAWTTMPTGAGGSTSQASITGLYLSSAAGGLVVNDASVGNVVAAPGAMQASAPAWIDRRTAAFDNRYPGGNGGTGPTDVFVGLLGNQSAGSVPVLTTPAVLRWTGSGFTDTGWPTAAAHLSPGPRAVAPVAPGHVLALASDGAVWRWNGGAWTTVAAPSGFDVGTAMRSWTADSAVMTRCRAGVPTASRVAVLRGGGVHPLPNTTIGDGTNPADACGFDVLARPGGEIVAALGSAVGRWLGASWQAVTGPLDDGETVRRLVACRDTIWGGTSHGRVVRVDGATLVTVSHDGSAATGATGAMACGDDGTLRVGSRFGLVTRRAGATWVDEHFAPQLRAVHVVAADRAVAVGDGEVVLEWTGAQWVRRRRGTTTGAFGGVYAAPDGSIVAVGRSAPLPSNLPGPAQLLRFTSGAGWAAMTTPGFTEATAVWGSGAADVHAIVRTNAFLAGAGRILRWTGTAWDIVLDDADGPIAVHGSGPGLALATGYAGRVWRWDGASWTSAPPIENASGRAVNRLVVFGPAAAWAGNNCTSGQTGGAWRWNGSTWTDAGLVAAGFSPCVHALFGTGPTDLFAVVGNLALDRRLVRWNGTTWTMVAGADVRGAVAGGGAPGLSVVVGNATSLTMGTVPGGTRMRR